MKRKNRMAGIVCAIVALAITAAGCSNKSTASNPTDEVSTVESSPSEEIAATESTTEREQKVEIPSDLKDSQGLEFESNGDGTCTIKGMGTCNDKELVIPLKSPAGDTVTLIDEHAFMSLEGTDTLWLINYEHEIDDGAFKYAKLKTVNILGGNIKTGTSVFSSCEDLTTINIKSCTLDMDENAFFSCGKDAILTIDGCTGLLDDSAFKYSELKTIEISNSELTFGKSAFSSCEDVTGVTVRNCSIDGGENMFFSGGKKAKVDIVGSIISMDKSAFKYASISELNIAGKKFVADDSAFSTCEDLEIVTIECDTISMGENSFFSCDDLVSVKINTENTNENTIEFGDGSFKYCEDLTTAQLGTDKTTSIKLGKYILGSCADELKIVLCGGTYNADMLKDGFEKSDNAEIDDTQETTAPTEVPANTTETVPEEVPATTVEESNNQDRPVIVPTDLKPSDGLVFESNGDGTCKITDIGSFNGKNLVIPEKSPSGEPVKMIDKDAFFGMEDTENVYFINATYEIGDGAFQYCKLKSVNFIGGSPIIQDNSFLSCEKLESILFDSCTATFGESAFFGAGKDTKVDFKNSTVIFDDSAFQYCKFESLSLDNSNLTFGKGAFMSCEDITSVSANKCTITADKNFFFGSGDEANVAMNESTVICDDSAFQYAKIKKMEIDGPKFEVGDSSFMTCEDMEDLVIESANVKIGKESFMGCPDLINIAICEHGDTNTSIEIEDSCFGFCEDLVTAIIGKSSLKLGENPFLCCNDALKISIAGTQYTAVQLEKGLK